MKYVNKLTDEEIIDLFKLFMGEDEVFVTATVSKYDKCIDIIGKVQVPSDIEPDKMIEVEDVYGLYDFNVKAYTHSRNVKRQYREYMQQKFGNEYASDYKDYLFASDTKPDIRKKIRNYIGNLDAEIDRVEKLSRETLGYVDMAIAYARMNTLAQVKEDLLGCLKEVED